MTRQLMRMPPSVTSICSVYPVQNCLDPFAMRLHDTTQSFGKSSNISSRSIVRWRARRLRPLDVLSPDSTSTFAGHQGGLLFLRYRLLTRFNRGRISGNMLNQMHRTPFFDQCLMDPRRQCGRNKFLECTRKRKGIGTSHERGHPHRDRST